MQNSWSFRKIPSKIRMLLATLQIEAVESLGPKRLKPAYQDPTYPKEEKGKGGGHCLNSTKALQFFTFDQILINTISIPVFWGEGDKLLSKNTNMVGRTGLTPVMPPVLRRQTHENSSLEASLSYRVKPYLRKTKAGQGGTFL